MDSGRSGRSWCFDCFNLRRFGCFRGLDNLDFWRLRSFRCFDYLYLRGLRSFGSFDHFYFRLPWSLRLLNYDFIRLLRLWCFDNLYLRLPWLRCLDYMDLWTLRLLDNMSLIWSWDLNHFCFWSPWYLKLDILTSL